MSRPQPKSSTDPLRFPTTTHLEVDEDDNHIYNIDICKDFPPVCYTVNCNNPATKNIKIAFNKISACIVYVCDSCYPKYLQPKDGGG